MPGTTFFFLELHTAIIFNILHSDMFHTQDKQHAAHDYDHFGFLLLFYTYEYIMALADILLLRKTLNNLIFDDGQLLL